MKQEVIECIVCECLPSQKFSKLLKLYNNHPHANESFAYRINANRGSTGQKIERLIHELRRLENISDVELYVAKRKTPKPVPAEKEIPQAAKEPNPPNSDKKFREDYPFLNDPEVPEEFKILAADKITSFKILTDGHEQLQAAAEGLSDLSEEMLAQIAKDVAAADELNALIHEEFDYYQKNNKILGKHPIFTERMIAAKVDKMTGEEKLKRFDTLNKDVKREKSNLAKAEKTNDTDKISKISKRLNVKEIELNLLRKLTQ